jgi:heptosyltransferase-2
MGSRILIRCPNWLGDIVMSIPAINAVKKAFPTHAVCGYVRSEYAGILKRVEGIDEVISFKKKNVLTELKMVSVIKDNDFDKAFIFPNSWTSVLIPFLAGVPEKFGYDIRARAMFFTKALPVPSEVEKRHQVYHYLELVKGIKGGNYDEVPRLIVGDSEIKIMAEKLGLAGKKVCGFSPAAAYGEAKCWFKERYVELGRELVKNGFTIIILGGKGDHERCREITESIGNNVLNLAGKIDIYELPVVLKICRLLISNDSGPMHVCAAVNTPVISIFGSTNPDTTYPFGFKHLVIHNELECSRCLERNCKRKEQKMLCMELIKVPDVLERIASAGLI